MHSKIIEYNLLISIDHMSLCVRYLISDGLIEKTNHGYHFSVSEKAIIQQLLHILADMIPVYECFMLTSFKIIPQVISFGFLMKILGIYEVL